MPRITLEYPDESFTFSTSMTVRTSDLNHGAHLGFDQMVSLIGHARYLFLRSLGIDELGVPGIVVGDLAVVYRAEAFRDDELTFEVGVAELNKYGGDIAYRVTRVSDGALVVTAKTGVVFIDTAAERPTGPPPAFVAAFEAPREP